MMVLRSLADLRPPPVRVEAVRLQIEAALPVCLAKGPGALPAHRTHALELLAQVDLESLARSSSSALRDGVVEALAVLVGLDGSVAWSGRTWTRDGSREATA